MKKVLTAALATAMLATPFAATAADAASWQRHTTVVKHKPNGRTVVVHRDNYRTPYRSWHRGERFNHRYARNYRVVDYRPYRGRGLYAPPRGYHWVRSGNDAVLVGITSGIIGAVIGGAIR